MPNKIQYGENKWVYLKDTRFIHIYLIVDGKTHELFGFTNNDAIKWTKVDNDFDLDSDFSGDPIMLQNHSSKGQITLSCNENGQAAAYGEAVIKRQKTYALGEIPTVGLKVVNDNNNKTVDLPYAFAQKEPDGGITNSFDNSEYTFLGWNFDVDQDSGIVL
ncbi:hypothetical protein FD13_GL000305 [Levilactobacillus senmaizukei DSM 21775 = NBRC 103853]|uniref:Uncharacterized protein n=1 Tax=Levilactobacillus senmaizukei DSM 21775 = NBRC 103853 TaxID=1423803 RepID=A0A0R2DKD1_9LACO|nr:hypothetical protein [Levilactobacillus senmaizukei]KRN02165.1 hypothetical protein FD13_GL000305 [Levilactobacillus senmaizukei DSM 21775 = NBRC 103853]